MRISIIATILLLCSQLHGQTNETLLARLDSCIEERSHLSRQKEQQINAIRRQLRAGVSDEVRLSLYEKMYDEYHIYRYDSAMAYVRRGERLARKTGKARYALNAIIHKGVLLSMGGFYHEAEETLRSVDESKLDRQQRRELNQALVSLYVFWLGYYGENEYTKDFHRLEKELLANMVALSEKNTPSYYYYKGEQAYIAFKNPEEALRLYRRAIALSTPRTRIYASSAYAIARYYKEAGNREGYVEWLTRAAIADQLCLLKENAALQELAMYLFENSPSDLERATRYIRCNMEDAQFYGNRLRILEISRKLPVIFEAYQKHINRQKRGISTALLALAAFTVVVLVLLVMVRRKSKTAERQRGLMDQMNRQLLAQHEELNEKKEKLETLNARLVETNKFREGFQRIFLDLCSVYINKIVNVQNLVRIKSRGNQGGDLQKVMASLRLSEKDAVLFFSRFDKAFLELYPHFIEDLNSLLKPDQQVRLNEDGSLTPELRIYALVRLGVKESSEIATLLFYSPQTIYNYRTRMKNRAIHKDTFDQDVAKLSLTI